MNLQPINDYDSRLAVELAAEISPVSEILQRHGLTADQLRKRLTDDDQFRNMYVEAKRTWKSDLSVKERIRIKSQVLVEDSLLELYSLFHNQSITPTARLDAFGKLAKVATVDGADKNAKDEGGRVNIQMNFGDPDNIPKISVTAKETNSDKEPLALEGDVA